MARPAHSPETIMGGVATRRRAPPIQISPNRSEKEFGAKGRCGSSPSLCPSQSTSQYRDRPRCSDGFEYDIAFSGLEDSNGEVPGQMPFSQRARARRGLARLQNRLELTRVSGRGHLRQDGAEMAAVLRLCGTSEFLDRLARLHSAI